MDHTVIAMLAGVGVLGGIIATIVGGAAIVVYPVLITLGFSPQIAAVTNLIALTPATMLAALADRKQLPPFNRDFAGLVIASIAGAGLGAALLVLTPERLFSVIVPLLLGFATVLFAFSERLGRWLRARAAERGRELAINIASLKFILPVSLYGGYFGAGVGIMMLAVFSVATGGDYRSANVTKNFVMSLNSAVATLIFWRQGVVHWPQTFALMAGTLVGGLAGSYLARIIPREVMRVLIVAVGTLLTVAFARRYWF
jgi:uncharacterized membrane protein YfcA